MYATKTCCIFNEVHKETSGVISSQEYKISSHWRLSVPSIANETNPHAITFFCYKFLFEFPESSKIGMNSFFVERVGGPRNGK